MRATTADGSHTPRGHVIDRARAPKRRSFSAWLRAETIRYPRRQTIRHFPPRQEPASPCGTGAAAIARVPDRRAEVLCRMHRSTARTGTTTDVGPGMRLSRIEVAWTGWTLLGIWERVAPG